MGKDKVKGRAKRYTISGLANKVAVRLQLLRRLEESDGAGYCTCITCGVRKHYKEMQGGHFIERGRMATRLEPLNIFSQCPGCNMFGMKKASVVLEYARKLDEIKPGLSDWLKDKSREEKKYSRAELEDLLEVINEKIKCHEESICS